MNRLSSFSVILVFVVLMIIGAGVAPLLNIQYTPTQKKNEISISFSWQGASAKVIEMEVTSKIEGIVSAIQGCRNIESHSAKGSGKVTAQFKKGADMEMIRFEIATMLRQIYKSFPDGVTYPALSASSAGDERQSILTFTVNADLPTQEIDTYIQDHIIKELALVDGVNSVDLSGATPFYRELSFVPQMLSAYKLKISDIEAAVRNSLGEYDIVGSVNNVGILLKHNADIRKLEEIPLKSVDGCIIRVGDVATVLLKEKQPTIYRRINGLNTINIDVYPEKYVNTLDVCAQVKERMTALSQNFPDKFSVIIASDVSVALKEELNKIYVRTILSLVILLLFVLIVSRSFKYLAVISFALFANIFISFIFYVLFDMEIHLYSLAGITVSLGIIIDTAIVMAAHYGYYKNRSVFISILAAQLTSIGALVVVFLLPESARANLTDFVGVVIINLVVSLFIAALLIPALVDSTSLQERKGFSGIANRRHIVKFNRLYAKYIHYGKKYMWVTFVVLFFGFGIPIDKLPTRMEYNKPSVARAGDRGSFSSRLDSAFV
ncbi:MAG: efflux RND transporter permease subunit, partial [Bacteroidales bacterium]|nr:efflux RND transporter permease subunit [Bacteroidales bacterium]